MKVSIVGAGFSGLSLAYYLVKQGAEVEILEKNTRAGGLIGTIKSEFGLAETAANGLLNNPALEELIAEIGVPLAKRLPAYKNRYIFRDGRARRWPLRIGESVIFVFKVAKAILTAAMKPRSRETVAEWGRRIGGRGFEKFLLTPGLQGIYAGDAGRLSASLILGRFFDGKRKQRPQQKGTVVPLEGMSRLIGNLTAWLESRGVRIRLNAANEKPSGDVLVVATSAWDAAEYLKDRAPDVASALGTVEALPVISATMLYKAKEGAPRGFGCLFPREEKFNSLGVLFMSDSFEGRGVGRVETWILGGALNPRIMDLGPTQLEEEIQADRKRLGASTQQPSEVIVNRWPKALPHYTREWEETIKTVKLPKGIYLTGNYLGRIGLSQILQGNKELAEKIHG